MTERMPMRMIDRVAADVRCAAKVDRLMPACR